MRDIVAVLRESPYSTFPLYQPEETPVYELPADEQITSEQLPCSVTSPHSKSAMVHSTALSAFSGVKRLASTLRPSSSDDPKSPSQAGLGLDNAICSHPPAIVGSITRTTLLKMLENRLGFSNGRPQDHGKSTLVSGLQGAREALKKLDRYPLKAPSSLEGQERLFSSLQEGCLDLILNLTPYMQRVPYIIPANASLSRTYRLFR